MKIFGVLILLIIVGCAPVKSLEQLEQEAMLTGDWSAVEKREKAVARKAERDSIKLKCPVGYIAFCQAYTARDECSCVSRRGMDEIFAWR